MKKKLLKYILLVIGIAISFSVIADNAKIDNRIFVLLAIITVIFLMLREVMCWYWKINEKIALLTEIRDLIQNQTSGTFNLSQSSISKLDRQSSDSPADSPE